MTTTQGKFMESTSASSSSVGLVAMTEQIRNAQLLLAYASEAGITLSPETIKGIVLMKHCCDGGQSATDPIELEIRFLQATEALAKAVSPVTVASLRASYDNQVDTSLLGQFRSYILRAPQPTSLASLAVRNFRFWALGTLSLLLFVQIYWVVGSSLTEDVTSVLAQIKEAEQHQQITNNENDSHDSRPLVDNQVEKLDEQTVTEAQMQEYEKLIELNFEILDNWNEYWRRPAHFFGRFVGGPFASNIGNEEQDPYKKLLKSLKTATFALQALQTYMLPILYGLLGSITYVLRTLAAHIRNVTYSQEMDICFRLRMILGTLSGLVIVWFIKDGGNDASLPFASLSPFAIAFVAGYSIELLFAAMDRFIAAFSGENKGA